MARKKQNNLLDSLFATVSREAEERSKSAAWDEKAELLRELLMPVQARLERDPSRRKAVRSPRQTGKSTGVMLIVSIRCLEAARAEWVVICVTRKSAKAIYWNPLKFLNEKYELGLEFHNQDLEARFPNGSTIRFVGMDNEGEMEKLRGGRYHGVVVDESKSYPIALFDELVHEVLEPALLANAGELILIGTPGDSLRGTFYMATTDEPVLFMGEDGKTPERQSNVLFTQVPKYPAKWSFHRWTLQDNITRFADGRTMWEKAQEVMKNNGWTRKTPQAAREYYGDWVPADDKRVYRYRPALHDYDPRPRKDSPKRHVRWGLPDLPGDFRTVLGVDLGTRDGTAMVVWAWNIHTNDLWEVYSDKRRAQPGERLPLSAISEWYKELDAEYGPFEGQVVDPGGLATLSIDTLAVDHQVYLEPAEKQEKNDHIEVMNNDFDSGRIHVVRNSLLSEELDSDRWNLKKLDKNKKVEDDSIPNDAADAGLYSHRWCRHRSPVPSPTQGPAFGSREWLEQVGVGMLAAARERARNKAQNETQLDNPWWN